MGWVDNATPRPLYPREGTGTHCIRGCVGPWAGRDGFGNPPPPKYSIPGMSNRYTDYAIPATLGSVAPFTK